MSTRTATINAEILARSRTENGEEDETVAIALRTALVLVLAVFSKRE